jgi:hypothetical protein
MINLFILTLTLLLISCSEPQFPQTQTPFPKAVCEDLLWESDKNIDAVISLMQDAGVTNIRLPVRWSMIETAKGTYDWTKLDVITMRCEPAQHRY